MRLTSDCTMAITEPTAIVTIATAQSTGRPVPPRVGDGDVSDPQQRAERGDLGARRHEAGDRGRRALVDVRRPDVERRGADLEQQADGEQRDAEEQQRLAAERHVPARAADRAGDGRQADGVGVAVDEGRAEEEERRRERAEQEVLQARLLGQQAAATGEAAHQVERQRQDLERDEHRQQVVRGGEQQHAADREQQQREDLGLHEPGTPGLRLGRRPGDGGGLRGERSAPGPPNGLPWSGRRGRRARGSCPAGTAPDRRRRRRRCRRRPR